MLKLRVKWTFRSLKSSVKEVQLVVSEVPGSPSMDLLNDSEFLFRRTWGSFTTF